MNKCLYSLHVLFLELGREFLVVSFGEVFFLFFSSRVLVFVDFLFCFVFSFFSLIPVITSRQNIRQEKIRGVLSL